MNIDTWMIGENNYTLRYNPFPEEKKRNESKGWGGGGYFNIECSPNGTDAKCSVIQDQLRPYGKKSEAGILYCL